MYCTFCGSPVGTCAFLVSFFLAFSLHCVTIRSIVAVNYPRLVGVIDYDPTDGRNNSDAMTIIWPVGGEGNETEDVKTERKKRQKLPQYELHTYIHTYTSRHILLRRKRDGPAGQAAKGE